MSALAEVQEAFRTLPERYLGAESGFDATYHIRLGDIELDPATREVLMLRQSTKAQEAQLAWRFVAWSLRHAGADLQDRARVAFLTALSGQAAPGPLGERERALLRYGVLGQAQRAALEQRVLRSAVLPCMENLLARPARA